jgi:hypothetical protein
MILHGSGGDTAVVPPGCCCATMHACLSTLCLVCVLAGAVLVRLLPLVVQHAASSAAVPDLSMNPVRVEGVC